MADTLNSTDSAPTDAEGAGGQQATPPEVASKPKPKRTRTPRAFPASSFLEALPLAEAIQKYAAGQKVRRLTLFEHLDRSPESSASRQLITNSAQYKLTRGSYTAEYLELTEEGKLASGDPSLGRARLAARIELAINKIQIFHDLYEQYKDGKPPVRSVMRDFVLGQGIAEEHADECVETFLANARDLGLLATYAGAERLLTIEHVLEEAAPAQTSGEAGDPDPDPDPEGGVSPRLELIRSGKTARTTSTAARVIAEATDLSDVCFMVTPIGGEQSEQRKHADLVLGSLIEPAVAELGLRVVRADKISQPGMITGQVIEHLVRAPLVVADLSFGNPNVYYELALRHAARLPAVQIIRASDHLPFDVGQYRTVVIDMSDIYSLVPQLETHRAEIARQCRAALAGDATNSPLALFYPQFWDGFGDQA